MNMFVPFHSARVYEMAMISQTTAITLALIQALPNSFDVVATDMP